MNSSICIIGLAKNFTKEISKKVSDKLDMFYADINDIFEYELDLIKAEETNGRDYVLQLQRKKVKTISSYTNTIITMSYSTLMDTKNHELLNDNLKIYLNLNNDLYNLALKCDNLLETKMILEKTLYADRHLNAMKIADIVINIENLNIDNNVSIIEDVIEKHHCR